MRRLAAAVRKEFRQFVRDRLLVALVIFTYTADVVMCTVALSFDVRHLKLAVFDADRSQLSAKLVERFTATDYFGRVLRAPGPHEVDRLLDSGDADLALMIPPGFAADLDSARTTSVQIVVSGTNSNTANAARGYADAIVGGFGRDILLEHAARHGVATDLPGVRAEPRIWYNPQLEFRHFMAVSMVVVAGIVVGVVTAAAGLVREKESGTIEQLIVTPLRSVELVAAKSAPPFTVGMLSLAPSLVIAESFGVPMAGHTSTFVLASALALTAFLAIGFFIATLAQSQQQALLLSFLVLFPLMFLSGTTVPIESMPRSMQWLSYLSPVRHYMEIAVGVLMKGVGIAILWPHLLALVFCAVALGGWSIARLKRDLYA